MPFSVTSGRRMIWCGSSTSARRGRWCCRWPWSLRPCALRLSASVAAALPLRPAASIASSAALVISNRCGCSTVRAFKSATGDTRDPVDVAGALVDVRVVARPWPPAGCRRRSFRALRIAAMSLVFGRGERQLVDQHDLRRRESSRPAPSAWPAARPCAAGGRSNRAAAWRRCDRRRDECRCAASRRGRCPCPFWRYIFLVDAGHFAAALGLGACPAAGSPGTSRPRRAATAC